jgi:hypothetical protein
MMKLLRSIALPFFLFILCGIAPATAQHTAADITASYRTTSDPNCNSSTRPAFLCDGVLIRATGAPVAGQHSWDPSAADVKAGGVSFSYLRTDANFDRLASNLVNGLIAYPLYRAPSWAMGIDFLCAYPLAAQTENRSSNGCGAKTGDTSGASAPCQSHGVLTAQDWMKQYKPKDDNDVGYTACGFTVAYKSNPPGGTAQGFDQMIATMNLLNKPTTAANISFNEQNELRAQAWGPNLDYKLPIWAFFYLDSSKGSGLKNAQADQKDFFALISRFVPIVKVTLPQTLGQQAAFNYYDSDQAVKAPTSTDHKVCSQYIQSGVWEIPANRPNSTHYSLTLVPTPCARTMPWADVDAAFAEVEQKFSSSPHWKNAMGLRNQFACHDEIAKNKQFWDIEPDRKIESYDATLKDTCNPVFE